MLARGSAQWTGTVAVMPRILVVDDDEGVREMVRLALEDEGYVVQEAGDGATGVEMLRSSTHPYIVLFDLIMPRVDGASFLGQVIADPSLLRHNAFVCFTASPNKVAPALAGLPDGFSVPVLPKPFEVEKLFAVVEQARQRLS